jgi:hypothetical protein
MEIIFSHDTVQQFFLSIVLRRAIHTEHERTVVAVRRLRIDLGNRELPIVRQSVHHIRVATDKYKLAEREDRRPSLEDCTERSEKRWPGEPGYNSREAWDPARPQGSWIGSCMTDSNITRAVHVFGICKNASGDSSRVALVISKLDNDWKDAGLATNNGQEWIRNGKLDNMKFLLGMLIYSDTDPVSYLIHSIVGHDTL